MKRLKEKLDKHQRVAVLCNGQDEFIKFIQDATTEIEFSRTINYQRMMLSKKSILKYKDKYTKMSDCVYVMIEKRHYNNYDDYNIHTRLSKDLLPELNYYIFDYSPYLRKEKIEKIKRKLK